MNQVYFKNFKECKIHMYMVHSKTTKLNQSLNNMMNDSKIFPHEPMRRYNDAMGRTEKRFILIHG